MTMIVIVTNIKNVSMTMARSLSVTLVEGQVTEVKRIQVIVTESMKAMGVVIVFVVDLICLSAVIFTTFLPSIILVVLVVLSLVTVAWSFALVKTVMF